MKNNKNPKIHKQIKKIRPKTPQPFHAEKRPMDLDGSRTGPELQMGKAVPPPPQSHRTYTGSGPHPIENLRKTLPMAETPSWLACSTGKMYKHEEKKTKEKRCLVEITGS